MKEFVGFKYCLSLSNFVLICEGDILEEGSDQEPKCLTDYPKIVDGCLITVTPVRTVCLQASGNKSLKSSEILICPLVRDINRCTLKCSEKNFVIKKASVNYSVQQWEQFMFCFVITVDIEIEQAVHGEDARGEKRTLQ